LPELDAQTQPDVAQRHRGPVRRINAPTSIRLDEFLLLCDRVARYDRFALSGFLRANP
jgi:hypothetical protein